MFWHQFLRTILNFLAPSLKIKVVLVVHCPYFKIHYLKSINIFALLKFASVCCIVRLRSGNAWGLVNFFFTYYLFSIRLRRLEELFKK